MVCTVRYVSSRWDGQGEFPRLGDGTLHASLILVTCRGEGKKCWEIQKCPIRLSTVVYELRRIPIVNDPWTLFRYFVPRQYTRSFESK